MLPQLYQTVLRIHLGESQYLKLQLLVMLLQSYRTVSLSRLAELFPQPIKYESRVRNLQRFLNLPNLTVRLLWFPIIKQLIKKEFRQKFLNRFHRRHGKKPRLIHQGYLLLVIDRTQWRPRNLMMLSLVWGRHALPVYWELLGKNGTSNLRQQKKVIALVLRLLRPYPIVVLGDREFQSVQLAKWLQSKGIDFALRQKKNTCISDDRQVYVALKDLEIKPGVPRFYESISCTNMKSINVCYI